MFTVDYLPSLPPFLQDALNKITGDAPYVVEFEFNTNDVRKYPLSLDFSQVGGVTSGSNGTSVSNGNRVAIQTTQGGERSFGGITSGTTGSTIPTYSRIIQDKDKLPYIKATDFSGTLTTFTEPQYLRFDAVSGTWEQIEALQKGIMNLKEDIAQDLMRADATLDKAFALEMVEGEFDITGSKYNWLNSMEKYKVVKQTGNIPTTATYTPAARNNPSTTMQFNK